VLTAAQMTSLQQTAMLGGAASAKTASYTLVAADAGTAISMTNASATTITVNTGLFAAGDTVQITNLGAGVCTITAGTATVNTSASLALAQYESGTLNFTSTSAAIFIKGAGTPASGGLALATIASGSLNSGTTLTLSSLSSYDTLILVLNGITNATGATKTTVLVNNDNTGVYIQAGGTEANNTYTTRSLTATSINLAFGVGQDNANANNTYIATFTNCKAAGFTNVNVDSVYIGASLDCHGDGQYVYKVAAAVSSLVIGNLAGYAFNGSGTYQLLGA
jgi:hypothetical protein